jgi:hypothetical protein
VVLEERRHRLRALQAPPAQIPGRIQVLVLNHEGAPSAWSSNGFSTLWKTGRGEVESHSACVLYSVVIGERVTELLDIPAVLKTAAAASVMPNAAISAAQGAN